MRVPFGALRKGFTYPTHFAAEEGRREPALQKLNKKGHRVCYLTSSPFEKTLRLSAVPQVRSLCCLDSLGATVSQFQFPR